MKKEGGAYESSESDGKRMRKTESLVINNPVLLNEHDDKADILYIGFISTKGAIGEGQKD